MDLEGEALVWPIAAVGKPAREELSPTPLELADAPGAP
jgi:hypothetical protein